MKGAFLKYKFTTSLFFNSIDRADFDASNEEYFQITVQPYFKYSGRYFIHSVFKRESQRTIFIVHKTGFNTNHIEDIDYPEIGYLAIYSGFKKVAIFDSKMNGIIFKR